MHGSAIHDRNRLKWAGHEPDTIEVGVGFNKNTAHRSNEKEVLAITRKRRRSIEVLGIDFRPEVFCLAPASIYSLHIPDPGIDRATRFSATALSSGESSMAAPADL